MSPHLTPTWGLAFVWVLRLWVCFTQSLSLSLSGDTHGRSPVLILPTAADGCISAGFRCRSLLIQATYRSRSIKLFLSSSPERKLVSFVNETKWAKCNLWRGRAQILCSSHLQNKHCTSRDGVCSAASCLYNKWCFEIMPQCIFKYQILLCF